MEPQYNTQPQSTEPNYAPPQVTTPPPIPTPPEQPQKTNHTKIIVILVVCFLAILISIAAAAFIWLNSTNKQSTQTNKAAAPAINTAVTKSDYSSVCNGDVSISNAADYDAQAAGPHLAALFEKGSGSGTSSRYLTSTVYLGNKLEAEYTKPETVQLVGCLSRNGDGKQAKVCDLKTSDGKIVQLKLISAPYDLKVYAAKTGKLVTQTTIDKVDDTTCPSYALYLASDPKYYALPNEDTVRLAVQTYVK